MKEWKIRQEYFHTMNKEYSDDLNKVKITLSDDIVDNAVRHFNEYVDEWIYPAKSYAVAICYASWIAEDFDEDFYELLNDSDLLAGNDPYFVPYEEDKYTYDEIIDAVLPLQFEGMVPDIREYYEEEILNAI
jgi:hypothetical protein